MNRLLILLVPDKNATLVAWALSAVAFLLGLLDMLTRDIGAARFHLNLSLAIMAFLFLIKYFSLQAAYKVAEQAQAHLRLEISKVRKRAAAPPSEADENASEAEEQAHEMAHMAELAGELKQALNGIPVDSPVRPKYEATLELMQRLLVKAAAH